MGRHPIIDALWLAFVVVWLAASATAKPTASRPRRRFGVALRLGLFVLALVLARSPALRRFEFGGSGFDGGARAFVGAALCVAGLGLALWARFYLGRNWGMPMTLREGHELVTEGPYRYARHPIYGGMLIAMIGSLLAEGGLWLPLAALFGAYFIYSARSEEEQMLALFPADYRDYKRRAKMLVPFLF